MTPSEMKAGDRELNKQSLALLERVFVAEVEAGVSGGIGVMQTKSRIARRLVEDGYLTEATVILPGRFAIEVVGYRLTHLGRMTYCSTCKAEP